MTHEGKGGPGTEQGFTTGLLAGLTNKQITKELSFISLLCKRESNTTPQGYCEFGWYNMWGGVEAG